MSINNAPIKTILILAANPKGTTSLQLDREVRDISESLQGLQQQYDLFNEKLGRLRNTIAIETDEAVCFKLEKQIERTQLECKRLDEQLEIINNKLQ
ncbi:hypothetical protein NIES2101_43160 [Calothrix sp. HK-06]|nr:hypothetical protein NIES2101_43160 [Calothrix sp. HK-06]